MQRKRLVKLNINSRFKKKNKAKLEIEVNILNLEIISKIHYLANILLNGHILKVFP